MYNSAAAKVQEMTAAASAASFCSHAVSHKIYSQSSHCFINRAHFPLGHLLFNTIETILRTILIKCISVETHTHVLHILFELCYMRMPESTIYKNINACSNGMSPEVINNCNRPLVSICMKEPLKFSFQFPNYCTNHEINWAQTQFTTHQFINSLRIQWEQIVAPRFGGLQEF
jgi:hypothetical protein